MSVEIGNLQRLTDEQVSSRLRAYTDGGRFQDSLRWVWGQAGDVIEECSRRHFGCIARLGLIGDQGGSTTAAWSSKACRAFARLGLIAAPSSQGDDRLT